MFRIVWSTVAAALLVGMRFADAQAQSWFTALTYQPATPAGSTNDFIGDFSWRGIGLDFRRLANENMAFGVALGWNVFTTETDEVVSAFGADFSGNQNRYLNAFPILANASWFLSRSDGARLFVGGNAGIYIIEQRLDIGLVSLAETNVHLGLAPEAGIALPLRSGAVGMLLARYNYAFSAGNVDDQSYLTFGIGVAWASGP